MSIDEIIDIIESYKRVISRKKKEKIVLNDILSTQIVSGLLKSFDRDNVIEIKYMWDYFPELFEEERKQFELEQQIEKLESFKEKRRSFARKHNERIRKE